MRHNYIFRGFSKCVFLHSVKMQASFSHIWETNTKIVSQQSKLCVFRARLRLRIFWIYRQYYIHPRRSGKGNVIHTDSKIRNFYTDHNQSAIAVAASQRLYVVHTRHGFTVPPSPIAERAINRFYWIFRDNTEKSIFSGIRCD